MASSPRVVLGARQARHVRRLLVEKNFSQLSSPRGCVAAAAAQRGAPALAGTVTPGLTMQLSPGTPVFRLHRIRFADDAPMALEYATVLASCLPAVESLDSSLYAALEKSGNRPVKALQRLRAVLLTAEQAKLLGADALDAGLLAERVGYLADGRAVEFSQSFYRGDTYDFVAELSVQT
jgi:GntR family transcriptional regulator